ncbi:MAG: hypothetical protein DCC65_16655 [Planctomycetota bacterium]|nr:MAG: hypothetical protein DCC65_16655 [Planctomycetota bacterium]
MHAARSGQGVLLALLLAAFCAPGCDTTQIPGLPNPDPTVDAQTAAGSSTDQLAGGSTGGSVSATALEQLSLERINRARLRPAQEAARYGIAIDEGIPGQLNASVRQPVALNANLNLAAREHSDDMLARNYFEHDTPEGDSPFDRMIDAGYVYVTAGENLAWRGTTGSVNEPETVEKQHEDLFVDTGIDGRGHRVTMLNGNFREVGIAVVRGFFTRNGTRYDSIMQTQDYGTSANSPTFVLGAVYDDANRNGQYDFGEGRAGVTVSLGDVSRTTNSGGGYSFAVNQSGPYTLRFPGNRTQDLNIVRGQKNIKIDLVNGNTIIINLGAGVLP